MKLLSENFSAEVFTPMNVALWTPVGAPGVVARRSRARVRVAAGPRAHHGATAASSAGAPGRAACALLERLPVRLADARHRRGAPPSMSSSRRRRTAPRNLHGWPAQRRYVHAVGLRSCAVRCATVVDPRLNMNPGLP